MHDDANERCDADRTDITAARVGVPYLAGALASAALVGFAIVVLLTLLGISLLQFLPVYGG